MLQEVFEKLRSLQDILSQKYDIEREITEIPRALTTKTELLNRLKKSYIDKNEQLDMTRERIKKLRVRLSEAETAREDHEKKMDLIKTQREYEALDKEIREASEREEMFRKELKRMREEKKKRKEERQKEPAEEKKKPVRKPRRTNGRS